jgi:hypothetical protein
MYGSPSVVTELANVGIRPISNQGDIVDTLPISREATSLQKEYRVKSQNKQYLVTDDPSSEHF